MKGQQEDFAQEDSNPIARMEHIKDMYDQSVDRLASKDRNIFRASAGGVSKKSLWGTTVMMDAQKEEAFVIRNKEYCKWLSGLEIKTQTTFSFDELKDLHLSCLRKSLSSFNVLLGYDAFVGFARKCGYTDSRVVKQIFEVFDIDNSRQLTFEELVLNVAQLHRKAFAKDPTVLFNILDLQGKRALDRLHVYNIFSRCRPQKDALTSRRTDHIQLDMKTLWNLAGHRSGITLGELKDMMHHPQCVDIFDKYLGYHGITEDIRVDAEKMDAILGPAGSILLAQGA